MKTKKTNPPPTDLTTVYVHKYENYVGGGEICEGQENDSWPSHEPKQVDSGIEKVTLARAGLDYDTFDLVLPKDKTVWVVSVKYSTGDTFGSSHGHLAIAGVYATKDEADYVAETILLTDLNRPASLNAAADLLADDRVPGVHVSLDVSCDSDSIARRHIARNASSVRTSIAIK
jgi:hypothetical protein